MNLNNIVSAIKQADQQHKPISIAIEGFGGAGKTTFAERLKVALGDAYAINLDDFIIKEKLTDSSPDKTGFDRARLERQVLMPASNGQSVVYQKLEWVENKLSVPIKVPNVTYLIIEGIASYHPDIEKYYDYKIWIDTPIDIATRRGKLRDAGNENEAKWNLWAKSDLAYQQKYSPEQRADFVISMT